MEVNIVTRDVAATGRKDGPSDGITPELKENRVYLISCGVVWLS